MIDWLLVDYGQTISAPFADDAATALAELAGLEPATLLRRYWDERLLYDLGEPAGTYWARVLGRDPAEVGPLVDALDRIDVAGWLHLDDATLPALLSHVSRTGVRMALLSNAPESLAAAIDRCDWARHFERRFYSCRLRSAKPDPATYTAALAELGVDPGRVLFIDDRDANTRAAAELGMPTVTFTSATGLEHHLRDLRRASRRPGEPTA